jgi:hypothetical protein
LRKIAVAGTRLGGRTELEDGVNDIDIGGFT